MNPGPFGMAQTGVPFGEVASVATGSASARRSASRRSSIRSGPVAGFACHRAEVSGQRLWGWARRALRHARCVLRALLRRQLLSAAVPRRLRPQPARSTSWRATSSERSAAHCDEALRETVRALAPRCVLGIGRFAERRAGSRWRAGRRRRLHPAPEPGEPGGQPRLGSASRTRPSRAAASSRRAPASGSVPLTASAKVDDRAARSLGRRRATTGRTDRRASLSRPGLAARLRASLPVRSRMRDAEELTAQSR